MKILLVLALMIPTLTGCASFSLFGKSKVQEVEIQTQAVERTRLDLKQPTPLAPRTPKWIVITPENAQKVWEKLASNNENLVLFAVTDNGYEELSINMAEIRNFINMQRQIIIKYKEYYEPEITE